MVQLTVQSYRRSLQEFSESPVMSRCNSLRSSHSHTGGPQSITEWLSLCEKDPVEILLDLGFGTEEPDVCTKIPPRFLSGSSVAKGIDIQVFLEAQKQRMDIELPSLYGRFRQLEVLDHITSALSSLLTDVNTQQTKAQETGGKVTGHLNAVKSRSVVTQAKRRRIGQFLRRASQQTALLNLGLLAPEEVSMPGTEEQPHLCVDIAERGPIQTGFSAHVTLGCLTQEQTCRDKSSSAYPVSQCPPALPGKNCASSRLVTKQLHLSSPCEVPAKGRPRKEPHLLLAQMLKKLAGLNCRPPDSFEMEEIQSFEDEIPSGNTPDTTLKMMMTRTSSSQSDSSGFMEELPESLVLQNVSLSGKRNIFSDLYNQQKALSHTTEFPLLNQDFHQNQDDCVGEVFSRACESFKTVSRPTKACKDQGEEISLLLTAENGKHQSCNAELQSFVQDGLCGMEEYKTERQHLEKEECTEENTPFKGDTQDEGDPLSSEFHCQLYFSTGHKNMNAALTELSDTNPESKLGRDAESERGLMENGSEVPCHRNVHRDCTECGEELWCGVQVFVRNGAMLAANEVTNRQFCKMGADVKKIRCLSRRGVPETLCKGYAAPSCSSQVSHRPPPCRAGGPELSSPNEQEIGGTREMLGTNKAELGDSVQNCEMIRTPLRSVTVQMPSGLEFTSRVKCTKQNVPCTESLARDDHVDLSKVLAHCSEGASPKLSDPGASEDGVKQTIDTPSQNGGNRKTRQLPVLCPPHRHLTKSASLDTMLSGKYKYRPHHCSETSGMTSTQGSPCCHYCCCHGCCCCLWTCPVAVSLHSPMGCCSNQAANKLQLLRTLTSLQENAMRNLPLCTHEIELMKISCQHFHEKLDEIERHLTEQQALFSNYMPEEGREESRNLQRLHQAIRQEMAELELGLNDRAYQVGEDILMQLDQLLVEQSHLFSELGLSDWKGERNAQNKQALPDAAGARSGCSEKVPQRAASKNTTAAGSLSALKPEAPLTLLPTRTMSEPNSSTQDLQEPSISKREIKRPPQAKTEFKALHNLKKSFQNPLGNDSAEGKD